MATVCDLVKSCVLLLLKIHDSVMITTPPYASCLVLIVNVSHCDVQWYLFFRIRYYTLRLAKSDVFTPKLWEAKWIVDEVSCNFQCCNDVIWAKNDHKLREWLKEASIHLKIPIILKSHLATSFGNVRLQERKITTQKERVEYMANSTQKKNRAISWQTYSFQYMEFLRNEEELTSVQVSPALWQGCAKKKANNHHHQHQLHHYHHHHCDLRPGRTPWVGSCLGARQTGTPGTATAKEAITTTNNNTTTKTRTQQQEA